MKPLCVGLEGLLEGVGELAPSCQAVILSLVVCSRVDEGDTLSGVWEDTSLPVAPQRAEGALASAKSLGLIADYCVTDKYFEVRYLK